MSNLWIVERKESEFGEPTALVGNERPWEAWKGLMELSLMWSQSNEPNGLNLN